MTKISVSFLALAAAFTVTSGASHAATWEHDLLNVQVLSPNPQTVVFNGNFNVPAANIALFGGEPFALSIGTTSVTFEYKGNAEFAFQNSTIVKVTDTSASPILNVQVDPSSTMSLDSSLISGNNFLQFDLHDVNFVPFGKLVLDVNFVPRSPIPEPATLAFLSSGLVGLLAFRRRRSRRI